MDFFERMALQHELHTYWNPTSPEAIDEVIAALDPQPGMRVLDIACGVGELLVTLVERHGVSGVGVDLMGAAVDKARENAGARVPDADLRFLELDGAAYEPEAGETFDVVSLVGASWIWQGYAGTLDALARLVRPGGMVLFGEPYWKLPPPPAEYIQADPNVEADMFTSLDGIRVAAAERGMRLTFMRGSTLTEWDRYEMLQARAADRWAEAHPDHPDRDEVLEERSKENEVYLRWGRDNLGFALFVFRMAESSS
ncbi:MAG: methyltransferase domain-containing protein [Planctomycetota bacterium]|nr:methyltransferase domain-containing protein [Planctomycetota bacterium]